MQPFQGKVSSTLEQVLLEQPPPLWTWAIKWQMDQCFNYNRWFIFLIYPLTTVLLLLKAYFAIIKA